MNFVLAIFKPSDSFITSNRPHRSKNTKTTTMKTPALDLNSKQIKSYATRENLVKAMTSVGADEARHLIVRNDSGRWVCILIGFHQHLLGTFPMVG